MKPLLYKTALLHNNVFYRTRAHIKTSIYIKHMFYTNNTLISLSDQRPDSMTRGSKQRITMEK